ncbi:Uncharacterized protein C3B8.09 [Tolypocladium ophioglossoides CBS 100239]|uniref:Uncharacterized protein C3B8.09 n=1 Tax=Tolypocladium ophioglossoides (strain CBS 100239) TaxID=1163406 RepID=A0A0L0NDK3_TOLOC|nr:Uncharacterized protein C3B8.09 [Tolypocladium ophioglossoides CBS 100239]
MGKKRKTSGRNTEPKGPKELDRADARLGPISTYEDVANSEDEYFLNQDKITLDDEPGSKRRRKEEEDFELSDEEILGYEDTDSDESEQPSSKSKKTSSKKTAASDEEGDEEEEEDSGWWGSSKREYYDADHIETEADALEEEVEAKRLQQKKLSKMREEDFVFDGDEWLAAELEGEENDDTVTEVLKDVEVTDDMGSEERSKLLATRYPEFEHLVNEFQKLQPVLKSLKTEALGKSGATLQAIKYWVLGCYVAALASYFAVLTSPARDSDKLQKPLAPSELRDHDIMETLVSCRDAWERVKHMLSPSSSGDLSPPEVDMDADGLDISINGVEKLERKKAAKKDKTAAAKQAKKQAKAKAIEDSVADLYNLPISAGKSKKRDQTTPAQKDDDNSDFGEEDALDARTAADKAARKKSLKFYTSQIAQKANRRAGAGRDAGGDMDIPHRERLRDRQARLLAAAEKRGKKGSKHGADLGDDSDEDDGKTANAMREDEDGYYDMVAHASKNKRDDKAVRFAAFAAANKADRVVEKEEVGEDGKRKITYAIEKNKGLTPKRGKDVRNPRVKRRKQYEAKQKKLKSMKPVWQGGEPKGGYRGELSGINTSVIKSVKL